MRVRPKGLAVFDVAAQSGTSSVVLPEVAGTMMAAGTRHVVSCFGEPKLIDIDSGAVLHRWQGVFSGQQVSSIIWHLKRPLPPLALDPARGRFALVSDQKLIIVTLRLEHLL
jgi:hypothetical protein